MLISVVTSFVTAMVVFMVFSQNLLYACTMKTIPAIETNRRTKKYRERKQECSLPRAKSPVHSPTILLRQVEKCRRYASKHASSVEAARMRKKNKKPLRWKIVLRLP